MVNCVKCKREFTRNEYAKRKQIFCREPECKKVRFAEAVARSKAKKKQKKEDSRGFTLT